MVNIESRYLANIENEGTIPSLPVIIQLVKICGLPMERYFNPEVMREESEERKRVSHKLKLCPKQYLPIVEGAIDGALKIEQLNDFPWEAQFSYHALSAWFSLALCSSCWYWILGTKKGHFFFSDEMS